MKEIVPLSPVWRVVKHDAYSQSLLIGNDSQIRRITSSYLSNIICSPRKSGRIIIDKTGVAHTSF